MGRKLEKAIRLASIIVPVVMVLSLGLLSSSGIIPSSYDQFVFIISIGLLFYVINRGYYNYKRRRLAEKEAQLEAQTKKDLELVAAERESRQKEVDEYRKRVELSLQTEHQKMLEKVQAEEKAVRKEILETERAIKERTKELKEKEKAIEIICEEKTKGFPWLANAFADYFYLQALKKAVELETKQRPANVTAKEIRDDIALKRREAEIRQRVYKYKLDYFKSLFPFLIDFEDEDIEKYIQHKLNRQKTEEEEEGSDPVRIWLTQAEFEKLSIAERNQLALDRYWAKQKENWEIGRDYERYIGYLFEQKGYNVYYQGIVKGLDDLGRDLIAKNREGVKIVQCKCWAKEKTIYEKHIFQLFGTLTMYKIDNNLLPITHVKGLFVTSTELSEKARKFAQELGIEIWENFPLQNYPSIKCNVSRKNGEKIYHLPFDQQYDKTLIEEERLECYVETVAEAEALGFRRAFRWRGDKGSE